jgi:hypothetical protein
MIEVFKTNVANKDQAAGLLEALHRAFPAYRANFDLQDCDRVLRVVTAGEPVHTVTLLRFLQSRGIQAEPLPDEPPQFSRLSLLEAISPN